MNTLKHDGGQPCRRHITRIGPTASENLLDPSLTVVPLVVAIMVDSLQNTRHTLAATGAGYDRLELFLVVARRSSDRMTGSRALAEMGRADARFA